MAAVRRKQAHRQPEPRRMFEAAIAAGSQPTYVERSEQLVGAVTVVWQQAIYIGWSCFAWAGGAVGAGSWMMDRNAVWAVANGLVVGGPLGFASLIIWLWSQRNAGRVTEIAEFVPPSNGHAPAGEPVRDARFVKPDATRPGHVVELPGDWTAERLQAFARRLAQVDYDVTVRSWVPQFCSYEQLKALLDWLEQHELVQVTDGRGTKAVRARAKRIMQQWADGHIDAL